MKEQITITKARELLGEKGKRMSDEQISSLLQMLRTMCEKAIDTVIQKNYSNVQQ